MKATDKASRRPHRRPAHPIPGRALAVQPVDSAQRQSIAVVVRELLSLGTDFQEWRSDGHCFCGGVFGRLRVDTSSRVVCARVAMQSINCRTGKHFRPPASVAPRQQAQPQPSAALSAGENVPSDEPPGRVDTPATTGVPPALAGKVLRSSGPFGRLSIACSLGSSARRRAILVVQRG